MAFLGNKVAKIRAAKTLLRMPSAKCALGSRTLSNHRKTWNFQVSTATSIEKVGLVSSIQVMLEWKVRQNLILVDVSLSKRYIHVVNYKIPWKEGSVCINWRFIQGSSVATDRSWLQISYKSLFLKRGES